jgi:hypothetical protein
VISLQSYTKTRSNPTAEKKVQEDVRVASGAGVLLHVCT